MVSVLRWFGGGRAPSTAIEDAMTRLEGLCHGEEEEGKIQWRGDCRGDKFADGSRLGVGGGSDALAMPEGGCR